MDYFQRRDALIEETECTDDFLDRGGCCCICGYNDNPIIIQEHHIAGRHNSEVTIPLCPNCHTELSKKQYSWDIRWNEKNNSSQIKTGFMLRGISDILGLISRILRGLSDRILGGLFNG